MRLFEGKTALITGAGGGIGFATASAFAEAGAAVIVADRDVGLIEAAANALRLAGHQAIPVICDVTDRGQVKVMVEQAVGVYGRLDAAFNNAGINCDAAPMSEMEDDEFDNVLNINLRGVWNCMKASFAR
jgi:NAD(P)-dependent dehydrogenase (short-subunit alcohol dehydrogenase family)